MDPDSQQQKLDPRIAFKNHDFKFYALSRLLSVVGWQMQSVAVGWQVYNITHSKLLLGYIGLVQFLPNVAFSLLTGHTADRFDKRRVMLLCQAVLIACSVALALITLSGIGHIHWIYAILFLIGTAQAFLSPSSQSLVPLIVPAEQLPNAVAWSTGIWHVAAIVGPALGGFFYWVGDLAPRMGGPTLVYILGALMTVGAFASISEIRARSGRMESSAANWSTVMAGVRYVFEQKVILGCISLDLFAVLLGGAVALLPVYARDILKVGTMGLGLLRGAPAAGALLTVLLVTHLPPMKRAGATMLWAVAGFGFFTVIFGISRNFMLSLACLALLGALDMISVVVRHTLVNTLTPKEMLGRVSAVNMVFIGASNELGEYESGLTAHWWGTVPAVVVGGLGTIAVVALWAWMFPEMRRIKRLDQTHQAESAQTGEELKPDKEVLLD